VIFTGHRWRLPTLIKNRVENFMFILVSDNLTHVYSHKHSSANFYQLIWHRSSLNRADQQWLISEILKKKWTHFRYKIDYITQYFCSI
jgi:hypothetical protein